MVDERGHVVVGAGCRPGADVGRHRRHHVAGLGQDSAEKFYRLAHGRKLSSVERAFMNEPEPNSERAAALQRWEDAGAIWRVIRRSASDVEIALVTCTGGEEVERFRSSDPEVLAFIGDRNASDD
jgi:hypothetical protein